jgi:hypothetical protein
VEERRSEPRVKGVTLVDVAEFNDIGLLTDLTMGRSLDLSMDGLRLELNHPIPVNSTLTLELELGERIVEVHATVRSVNPVEDPQNGGERWAMGVRFKDLKDDDYEALKEFVELHGE